MQTDMNRTNSLQNVDYLINLIEGKAAGVFTALEKPIKSDRQTAEVPRLDLKAFSNSRQINDVV